jgi:hypothetical protein
MEITKINQLLECIDTKLTSLYLYKDKASNVNNYSDEELLVEFIESGTVYTSALTEYKTKTGMFTKFKTAFASKQVLECSAKYLVNVEKIILHFSDWAVRFSIFWCHE